jgi:hypothetical protein
MRFLMCAALCLSVGNSLSWAQDPIPPAPGKPVEGQYVVEMKVWERLRDRPRAKPVQQKATSAEQWAATDLEDTKHGELFAESSDKVWEAVDYHPLVFMLAQPKVVVLAEQQAVVSLMTPRELPYFVRQSADTFKLMKTEPKELGVEIKLMLKPVEGDAERIEISPLEFSVTTLDRREKLDGLDLDVGRPVVSTRKLETSAIVKLGKVYETIIPSPNQKSAFLAMRVERVEEYVSRAKAATAISGRNGN